MANEILIQATLQILNGSINSRMQKDYTADQYAAGCWIGDQVVGMTAESLYLTGVVNPRAIFIENTDPNNTVDIGPVSAGNMVPTIRLQPGEACVMPLWPGVALKAQCADAVAETGGTDMSAMITYMVMET